MGSPKASDWFASVATSQQPVLQPVNLAIFTTSSLFNPLAVPAPHLLLLFLAHQPSPHYGRPLSVSGRPCYILPMFFYLFFYGRLILRPWLTAVRESFTHGGP